VREEQRDVIRVRVRNLGFEFFDESRVAIGADENGGGGGNEEAMGNFTLV